MSATLRQKLDASRSASPGDSDLFAAIAEADKQLDGIDRTMFFRASNKAPAANHLVLDEIRRIADRLKAAADAYQYQWGSR